MDTAVNALPSTLKTLLEKKASRDQRDFTVCQLAKALNMPHSMLVKLMHPDPSKRVTNPRIDTLSKIVEFFRADGFNITIEDLLTGLKGKTIGVQEQDLGAFTIEKNVSVYSFDSNKPIKLGVTQLKLATPATHLTALLADEDIKPLFKKGSIFVVDTKRAPENDTLVAAKFEDQPKILIRKFYQQGHKKILKSYNEQEAPLVLLPTMRYAIIGVVVQVNAKT